MSRRSKGQPPSTLNISPENLEASKSIDVEETKPIELPETEPVCETVTELPDIDTSKHEPSKPAKAPKAPKATKAKKKVEPAEIVLTEEDRLRAARRFGPGINRMLNGYAKSRGSLVTVEALGRVTAGVVPEPFELVELPIGEAIAYNLCDGGKDIGNLFLDLYTEHRGLVGLVMCLVIVGRFGYAVEQTRKVAKRDVAFQTETERTS